MKKEEIIEMNRNGWNELIKANKPFANTILPEYGPFLKRNEEEIGLFENLENSKVLDLGCGEGESLEYLYERGAAEVWGLDISSEQIDRAKRRFPQFENHFFTSPMEDEVSVPANYFDYVISIFSIGYTSDLYETFKNAHKYLKDDGSIIISWTHPFYYCLDVVEDKVIVGKSYFSEESEVITKGPNKVNLAQKNLMISSVVNEARKAGFYLDVMLEEETVLKDDVNGYKSSFWRKEKTVNCPSTIIYKFKKINEKS
ncbi:MAG TPA: class I SAM-dependent methyltransferase [Firmicutes bacterium]|nr:class I SAM-dependent methyltransferase [Bacillota bacterium]